MRERRRVEHTYQDEAEFLAHLDTLAEEDPEPAPEELRRLWSRRDTFVTAPPCCADRPCSQDCKVTPINLGALACVFISVLSFALGLVGVAVRGSTPWALIPEVMLGSAAIICLRMPPLRRRRRR